MKNEASIRRVAVIGSGVMGAGIAQAFSQGGVQVRLYSRSTGTLKRAVEDIETRQKLLIDRGLLSEQDAKEARERLTTTTSLASAVENADFINENIREELSEKLGLFSQLDELAPKHAIFSSNTSSLSLASISSSLKGPSKFIGLHWMNPAHLMPVVEVICTPQTSKETLDSTCSLAREIRKVPVLINKETPGFVVNRLQYALFREAFSLVEEGVTSTHDVDSVLRDGLGFRWAVLGAFEHMDLCGLDTIQAVSKELFCDLDSSTSVPKVLLELVNEGELGIKTGGGFYGSTRESLQQRAADRDHDIVEMLKIRSKLSIR